MSDCRVYSNSLSKFMVFNKAIALDSLSSQWRVVCFGQFPLVIILNRV